MEACCSSRTRSYDIIQAEGNYPEEEEEKEICTDNDVQCVGAHRLCGALSQ